MHPVLQARESIFGSKGAVLFWNSSRLSKDKSGEVAHITVVAANEHPLQVPKTNNPTGDRLKERNHGLVHRWHQNS